MADPLQITKSTERAALFIAANLIIQIYFWIDFLFFINQRGGTAIPVEIGISVVLALVAIYYTVIVAREADRFGWLLAAFLIFSFSLVLSNFAQLYWHLGTAGNFTTKIAFSKLDAIYFSLGIISTAGTGDISPTSQLARGVVTAQMAVDLLLILVAAALVVARLAER